MPCLVRHCSGHYSLVEQGGLPLYQHLYGNGDVQRIVAREHTGLLPRADRERIEKQFINHTSCRDTNLLSATSTLEMGINIGDLSTVLLASVPPEPSNYLQRIGRAGRRDGKALVGTVVNSTAHDLYFYSEPKAALQGSEPSRLLSRCCRDPQTSIDRLQHDWVQSGIGEEALPKKLKTALDAVDRKRTAATGALPFTWLAWTKPTARICSALLACLQASWKAPVNRRSKRCCFPPVKTAMPCTATLPKNCWRGSRSCRRSASD